MGNSAESPAPRGRLASLRAPAWTRGRHEMQTATRGRGRQLIAWHSSPYPIWSAAGPGEATRLARWPSSVRGTAPGGQQRLVVAAAPRGRFPSAQRGFSCRHAEHVVTGMTGVETAMELNSTLDPKDRLADRFSQFWADGVSTPDVFAFLSSHPDVLSIDRLEVLLIDQEERWRRGKALPLRIYLSAFSDIAANGELVRALVDGDRRERRRAAGRHDGAHFAHGRPRLGGPHPAEFRRTRSPRHRGRTRTAGPWRTPDRGAAPIRGMESAAPGAHPFCRPPSSNSRSHWMRLITCRRKPKACGRC